MVIKLDLVCTDPDCSEYQLRCEVFGWRERDRFEPMIDEDRWCPECGAKREIWG